MKWSSFAGRFLVSVLLAAALALLSCVPNHLRTMALPDGCRAWAKLPLTVTIDDSADAYAKAFVYGEKTWNEALGRPVFKTFSGDPTEGQDRADVLVVVGDVSVGFGAQTDLRCPNGRVQATIVVRAVMDRPRAFGYAVHELGHALGVGHNPNKLSLMYWQSDNGLMSGEAGPDAEFLPIQRLLPSDVRLAQALHP
jgi:hypothetical protein